MNFISLFTLFFILGCSHPKYRSAASFGSEEMHLGTPEMERSQVKKFPPEISNNNFRFYFYVELKDSEGEPVDVFNREFKVLDEMNNFVPFRVKRIVSGQYYLIVDKDLNEKARTLKFMVSGKKFEQEFTLSTTEASPKHSFITIDKNQRHRVKFILTLRDQNNRPVELPSNPEFILDGNAVTEDIKYLKDGKWEFHIIHPEENQVIYISVRAHSAYFPKLYRYHYVER